MKESYIEFLTELCTLLDMYEKSNWSKWMEKSSKKFKETEDVEHFLSAFGGIGSFTDYSYSMGTNDELTSVINVLSNITYSCANSIKDNDELEFNEILDALEIYYKGNSNYEYYTVKYFDNILNNYTSGNLHEITTNYLGKDNIKVKSK